MAEQNFDVVVVGGGPGGYVAAIRAAQLGLRTAVVEKAHMGGICLNWGCIPTKALLRSADVLRLMTQSSGFGIQAQGVSVDLQAVVARSRSVSAQLQRGVSHLMKKNGVTVLNGHGRLAGRQAGRNRLSVRTESGELTVLARHVILATGARARSLPDFPVDGQSVWSYREALVPKAVPKRLAVIGAGVIGIEFASFYRAMGAQVRVIEMGDRILAAEDEEVSAHVAASLKKDGIELHTGTRIVASGRQADGCWKLDLQGPGTAQSVQADVVLVAAGIVGNVEELGLEGTAVKVDRSHIVTDAFCATGEPGVYAIGDVAGAPWLAHKASHEAVICVEHIAGLNPAPLNADAIPACTYSHPQVAHVGLTETQAKAGGRAVRVGRFPFMANGKALAMGSTEGFVKVIFDEQSGELLGAHMVGDEVTEMIQGYAIAMGLETTEEDLMHTVFAHPTQSEAMHEAVLAAYGRALHI
ncbi:MAG: dihydrolipoyl dehydrogenase [Alcaligenes sp.]